MLRQRQRLHKADRRQWEACPGGLAPVAASPSPGTHLSRRTTPPKLGNLLSAHPVLELKGGH